MMNIIINLEFRPIINNRIKSIYLVSENGDVFNTKSKKYLKHEIDKDGYHRVSLLKKGKRKSAKTLKFNVHRLVAFAFIKNIENKPDVNHIDGDKDNNHYSNLEWCTKYENNIHSWYILNDRHIHKGEECHQRIFNEELVHKICKLLEQEKSVSEIVKYLNLYDTEKYRTRDPVAKQYRGLIYGLKYKTSWKHIISQYNY